MSENNPPLHEETFEHIESPVENDQKINSHTPIHIEQFTIDELFDSETIRNAVNAFISFLQQTIENDKSKFEISKKELDNQLEFRKLNIKEQEIRLETEKLKNDHLKSFDIRNKWYSFGMLVFVLISVILLLCFDILSKEQATPIIMLVLGLVMSNNKDALSKFFNDK
jgi:hypothetical protein